MLNEQEEIDFLQSFSDKIIALKQFVSQSVIGQQEAIDAILMSIFCNGHVLLTGVPGLAKTLLIHTVSKALGLNFNRIQFTPDLMPSDILGAEILDANKDFKFIKGPIFCNVLLADEINRTPPKTQAALLEAMQEKTVTIAGKKHILAEPFFVFATQNPLDQSGTYLLPEAQLDRFMFSVHLDYPSFEEEVSILQKKNISDISSSYILSLQDIATYQNLLQKIPITDNVIDYIVKLVNKTRPSSHFANEITKQYIRCGAGPRASQYLLLAAKCNALFQGKLNPDVADVKAVATWVLQHRILTSYKAQADGLSSDKLIKLLL